MRGDTEVLVAIMIVTTHGSWVCYSGKFSGERVMNEKEKALSLQNIKMGQCRYSLVIMQVILFYVYLPPALNPWMISESSGICTSIYGY